jgi:hypothetical protein
VIDDVSKVAAEWCFKDVEGEEVEIGRFGKCEVDFCGFGAEEVVCFVGGCGWVAAGDDGEMECVGSLLGRGWTGNGTGDAVGWC